MKSFLERSSVALEHIISLFKASETAHNTIIFWQQDQDSNERDGDREKDQDSVNACLGKRIIMRALVFMSFLQDQVLSYFPEACLFLLHLGWAPKKPEYC